MAVSLPAIASPVVYGQLVAWNRRRKDKRFKNLDYLTACATVNAYTQFSPKISSAFIEHRILRKFEELCPEGVPEQAVYNGYLLNEWLRFNAAELLIKNQNEFKGLPMKPMLDPARDLAGATPEKLAKALFRRTEPLRPGTRRKPVVRDQVPVEKVATDQPGDGVPHLRNRS